MIVLDTDLLSVLEWEGHAAETLRADLRARDSEDVVATIISFEEQMRGWMGFIAKQKKLLGQIEGYRRLLRQLQNYSKISVLPFEERTAVQFQNLRKLRPQDATMDLKIAAVVMVNDATLWTGNIQDFREIPNLKIEQWPPRSTTA